MTKTGNTAISVGYEKTYKNESFHFAMSNVTFILEFFWFESPTATGLVCTLFALLTSSRRIQILVLTSIRPSPHYLLFAFQEHVTFTMAERLSAATNCML